jgi:hypothetical protein
MASRDGVKPSRTGQAAVGGCVLLCVLLTPASLVVAFRADLIPSAHVAAAWLVAVGFVAWASIFFSLTRSVANEVRHGTAPLPSGPLGWAAVRVSVLVLVVAPFLEGATPAARAAASPRPTRAAALSVSAFAPTPSARHLPNGGHRGRVGAVVSSTLGNGVLLTTLAAAARRVTRIEDRVINDDEGAIDAETALLGVGDPPLPKVAAIAGALAAEGLLVGAVHVVLFDGGARLDDASWCFDPDAPRAVAKCVALVLGELDGATHLVLIAPGGRIDLSGHGVDELVEDSLRVAPSLGLATPVAASPDDLLYALATRSDEEIVVCVAVSMDVDEALSRRCAVVSIDAESPYARRVGAMVELADGRALAASSLSDVTRSLLSGVHDRSFDDVEVSNTPQRPDPASVQEGDDVVVRLLTAVPRVDGLAVALESGRERRGVELVAYLSLHPGEPVTGERLRVRVLGNTATDAAAKTLFNVASQLRHSLGEGRYGVRLPPAGRFGHYGVAPDVVCDVAILEARVAMARTRTDAEERIAWLRAALELIESEPFATVLAGYDWFLSEGHLTRLQVTCEDAACALVDLCTERGLFPLAAWAIDRARLVEPYSEALSAAAVRLERARQASFDAIAPAERSTVPSAPATR